MKRNNLVVLAVTSFLRGANNSIYSAIWQPFAASLGAPMSLIGIFSAIGGNGGLFSTLVQPIGGRLADSHGRKPLIIFTSIATIATLVFFEIASLTQYVYLLIPAFILLGLSAISRPANSSLTAESTRTERHASTFSLMMAITMVPGIIAPVIGGWLAENAGYSSVFPLMLVLEATTVLVLWVFLTETRNKTDNTAIAPRKSFWELIVPPRHLRGFYFATAGDSFAWGLGYGILPGMLNKTLHFSVEQLGIMTGVMSLSWALMQYPIGRFVDKRGMKATMVFSESLGPIIMLIWMTQTQFEVFVASQVLFALTAATWVPVTSTYLTRSVSASERAEAFGRANLFRGIIAFPAPAIGGFLYEIGGMSLPLIANMIGSFIVTMILIFMVHEPREIEANA
jgi:MFS family permease